MKKDLHNLLFSTAKPWDWNSVSNSEVQKKNAGSDENSVVDSLEVDSDADSEDNLDDKSDEGHSKNSESDFSLGNVVNAHLKDIDRESDLIGSSSSVVNAPFSACPFNIPMQSDKSSQPGDFSYIEAKQIEILKKEVETPEIQQIFQTIIDHSEFLSITGRILPQEGKK